jgi:hypothetical protein
MIIFVLKVGKYLFSNVFLVYLFHMALFILDLGEKRSFILARLQPMLRASFQAWSLELSIFQHMQPLCWPITQAKLVSMNYCQPFFPLLESPQQHKNWSKELKNSS